MIQITLSYTIRCKKTSIKKPNISVEKKTETKSDNLRISKNNELKPENLNGIFGVCVNLIDKNLSSNVL